MSPCYWPSEFRCCAIVPLPSRKAPFRRTNWTPATRVLSCYRRWDGARVRGWAPRLRALSIPSESKELRSVPFQFPLIFGVSTAFLWLIIATKSLWLIVTWCLSAGLGPPGIGSVLGRTPAARMRTTMNSISTGRGWCWPTDSDQIPWYVVTTHQKQLLLVLRTYIWLVNVIFRTTQDVLTIEEDCISSLELQYFHIFCI